MIGMKTFKTPLTETAKKLIEFGLVKPTVLKAKIISKNNVRFIVLYQQGKSTFFKNCLQAKQTFNHLIEKQALIK